MCGRYYVDGEMAEELQRVVGIKDAGVEESRHNVGMTDEGTEKFRHIVGIRDAGAEEFRYGAGPINAGPMIAGSRPDRRDVFPSQEALVLAGRHGEIRAERMLWGFPRYKGKGLVINARSETAMESAMFRDSLLKRRCVVPAGGFYEWNPNRERVTFRGGGAPVLYMAGIYAPFGEQYRYVILTTGADRFVSPVHPRMPLLLDAAEIRDWIFDDDLAREALLKTAPVRLIREQEYEQQTMRFSVS